MKLPTVQLSPFFRCFIPLRSKYSPHLWTHILKEKKISYYFSN
jgi:hypothetical protein